MYRAVTKEQLIEILGRENCSPMAHKNGYVIGPDAHGRPCHCSTHDTLSQAIKRADKLNEGNHNESKRIIIIKPIK